MAFEFFFGVFGLISSDSSSRHKSRLDDDWRLFAPLGASLFRDASSGQKSPTSGLAGSASGSPPSSLKSPTSDTQQQRPPPIFSTGTLGTAASYPVASGGGGVVSSVSSSSATSVASSGSNSSTGSTATLIKAGPKDILDTILGTKNALIDKAAGLAREPADEDDHHTDTADDGANSAGGGSGCAGTGKTRARSIYCMLVCLGLWVHVLRVLLGLVVERSLMTLDFYYLGASRIHFLIPALCLAIQAAAVSLIFIRNNDETNWLVPFYSSKDYLIRSRSNFRPKMEDYTRRVNLSVAMSLVLGLTSSVSLSAYLVHCVMQSEAMRSSFWSNAPLTAAQMQALDEQRANRLANPHLVGTDFGPNNSSMQADGELSPVLERTILTVLLIYDILWAIYSTYICFLVSFYFNLICSIMKSRFHGICKIIEDLTESNTTKTTNQARKITTLYLEHNEACELLDESNDFWQYLIFFTYFTYIPAYCYCLYNLFFVDFEAWPSFITWVIHTHTGFIILLISFSAAGVSTEIATFLHRVRGLTIGYSCYDLFAITNGSMSNTAAACASYFLIVADFNRSSVFTLNQMNSSTAAGTVATVTGGGFAGPPGAGMTTPAPSVALG